MEIAKLCEFCSEINFEALRNPVLSDLPALRDGRADSSRHPFKDKRDDAHKLTSLGSFGDIIVRGKKCQLCRLIRDSFTRHRDGQIDEDDLCQAETSFFGVYRDPKEKLYWIRRLSILVKSKASLDDGALGKSLYQAFQACDPGGAAVQVDASFIDPRPGTDMMVFGGRQRPLQLDLRWVRRWMSICTEQHGRSCDKADIGLGQSLATIRFVEVKQRCVVTFSNIRISDCRYLALSYVWGGPQKLKLESSNIDDLSKPGSLATSLPRTIENAMQLTQSLGIDYIWIDALCILQDNDQDKRKQIGAISQIYNFSIFTIIAASGSMVDAGLPGLHPGTRYAEQEELHIFPASQNGVHGDTLPGLSLMATLNPLANPDMHYLEQTPWSSRGWTMQERVMSRRVLIFTSEQVYWVCREATFCEESFFENDLIRFNRFHESAQEWTLQRSFRNFYEPKDEHVRFWKTYQNLVASYTRRNFSDGGDIYDAFLAILQGLSTLGNDSFAWGLPLSHFEQGLLWTSFTGLHRRQRFSTLPMTSMHVKIQFPSWSWMGWIGETSVCIGDEHCDVNIRQLPETLCFVHYHNPFRLERVRPARVSCVWDTEGNSSSWKAQHNQAVTISDLATQYPKLLSEKIADIPEMQLVFFWASSAFFALGSTGDREKHGFTIIDSLGNAVGSTGTLSREDWTSNPPSKKRHEFVVVGSRRNKFSVPMVLVLQIEWQDMLAYRVNCGEIREDSWDQAPHEWKLIPLG